MEEREIKILLIEDNPGDARLIQEMLAEAKNVSFDMECTDRLSTGLMRIGTGGVDVVLLDLSLPDSQGIDTFTEIYDRTSGVPIIVLSGLDDEELAVKAVQKGAQDYLVKGHVDSDLLVRAIKYSIERKKTEKALKNSEEKFRRILEFSPDAITVSNLNGMIIECNQATLALHGYSSKDEVIGKSAFDHIVKEDHEKAMMNLKRTLELGSTKNIEYISLAKNGREIPVEISAGVIRDVSGIPISIVSIAKDITKRRQAEKLLKQYIDDLERSNVELKQDLDELLERVRKRQDSVRAQELMGEIEGIRGIFLYPSEDEAQAHSQFISMVDIGLPTLAVVRTPPDRFRDMLGRDVEIVWLTTNHMTGTVCLDPSNITRLSMVLREFFDHAPNGVVLFEGVEYMLSIVEFKALLKLIQFLNDKIALSEGSIFMVLDMGVLEEKEAGYLRRECLPPPKNGEKVEEGAKGHRNNRIQCNALRSVTP